MEIVSYSKSLEHMLISCHYSPHQHENFLSKRHLNHSTRHHRALAVNNILKELCESLIQRLDIRLPMQKFNQTEVLIHGQIFD